MFKLKASALNIKLPATGEQDIKLSDYKGSNIILFFYPKDSTPGCTQEGKDFSALVRKLKNRDTVVLGVSRDSIKSHEKFKEKQGYKFDLISDADEKLCKAFDVIKLKRLYGREYMGLDRSTFVLDKKGKLVQEWRGVKVKGHAEEVFNCILELG